MKQSIPALVVVVILLAITLAALFEARATSIGVRELKAAIEQERKDMQGIQSIKHTVQTPAGPADVTTFREHNQTTTDWMESHAAALRAAMGVE